MIYHLLEYLSRVRGATLDGDVVEVISSDYIEMRLSKAWLNAITCHLSLVATRVGVAFARVRTV